MTTIETEKYTHKPQYVDAVRVTEENMKDIATWCHSPIRILKNDDGVVTDVFIKLYVARPITNRQTKAYVGDWVLCIDNQFRIYTDHEFHECFDPIDEIETSQEVALFDLVTEENK